MAKKISELAPISALAGGDLIPVVDISESATKKATVSGAKDFILSDAYIFEKINGSQEFPAGIAAYWLLDSNGVDIIGNYSATSIAGDVTFGHAGQVGSAAHFTGTSSDKIHLPDTIATNLGGKTGCTLEFWTKTNDTGTTKSFFETRISSTQAKVYAGLQSGKVLFGGRSSTNDSFQSITGNLLINDNTWHHVACTMNISTNTLRIYIDGSLDKSESVAFGASAFTSDTGDSHTIGAHGSGSSIAGYIDNMALYHRVLTEQEIVFNYNRGVSGLTIGDLPKGIVLKSLNGTYWRVFITNSGELVTMNIGTTRPE